MSLKVGDKVGPILQCELQIKGAILEVYRDSDGKPESADVLFSLPFIDAQFVARIGNDGELYGEHEPYLFDGLTWYHVTGRNYSGEQVEVGFLSRKQATQYMDSTGLEIGDHPQWAGKLTTRRNHKVVRVETKREAICDLAYAMIYEVVGTVPYPGDDQVDIEARRLFTIKQDAIDAAETMGDSTIYCWKHGQHVEQLSTATPF